MKHFWAFYGLFVLIMSIFIVFWNYIKYRKAINEMSKKFLNSDVSEDYNGLPSWADNTVSFDDWLNKLPGITSPELLLCPARWHIKEECRTQQCAEFHKDFIYMIIHLNDDHKWSFEEIANWLDIHSNQTTIGKVNSGN